MIQICASRILVVFLSCWLTDELDPLGVLNLLKDSEYARNTIDPATSVTRKVNFGAYGKYF
jgi:hypothetical protein